MAGNSNYQILFYKIWLLINIITSNCSEEPLEHCNKDVKAIQIDHSRQAGYVERNKDTAHWLLDRSDPQVLVGYSHSPSENRTVKPYPARVKSWCQSSAEIEASL